MSALAAKMRRLQEKVVASVMDAEQEREAVKAAHFQYGAPAENAVAGLSDVSGRCWRIKLWTRTRGDNSWRK